MYALNMPFASNYMKFDNDLKNSITTSKSSSLISLRSNDA